VHHLVRSSITSLEKGRKAPTRARESEQKGCVRNLYSSRFTLALSKSRKGLQRGLQLVTSLYVELYITIDYLLDSTRVCPLTPRRRILTFCISPRAEERKGGGWTRKAHPVYNRPHGFFPLCELPFDPCTVKRRVQRNSLSLPL